VRANLSLQVVVSAPPQQPVQESHDALF
jgi:hypothetical protein